jgi:hypothetical protein
MLHGGRAAHGLLVLLHEPPHYPGCGPQTLQAHAQLYAGLCAAPAALCCMETAVTLCTVQQ